MNEAKTIKIFSEKYTLRKTFDILDHNDGIYGFDILDADNNFLFHIDGESEKLVEPEIEIRWRIYRSIL